jgi:hypothetical protein
MAIGKSDCIPFPTRTRVILYIRVIIIFYSDDGFIFSTAYVDYGYYETVQDLIAAVNKALVKEAGNRNITVSFDPRTAKVKVTIKQRGCILALATRMSAMLGFGGKDVKI